MDEETLRNRLSFTVFISFCVIIFAQSKKPSYTYIYMNCLSLPVSLSNTQALTLPLSHTHMHTLELIRNYEGKTKKSDSSFCRGPLMISLKWLTALNSIGNLLQSKQIWSILETAPAASLGERCNMSAKHGVRRRKRGGGAVNEGDLRRGGVKVGISGSSPVSRCPPNRRRLSPASNSLLSHLHPAPSPARATFIFIVLMNIINISPLYWWMLFDSHGLTSRRGWALDWSVIIVKGTAWIMYSDGRRDTKHTHTFGGTQVSEPKGCFIHNLALLLLLSSSALFRLDCVWKLETWWATAGGRTQMHMYRYWH